VVLVKFGQMGADHRVWCLQCGVPASVLVWGCAYGPSWDPPRVAASLRPRITSTSNTVLDMRDSTNLLTKRGRKGQELLPLPVLGVRMPK
jgi:hypothetical protein